VLKFFTTFRFIQPKFRVLINLINRFPTVSPLGSETGDGIHLKGWGLTAVGPLIVGYHRSTSFGVGDGVTPCRGCTLRLRYVVFPQLLGLVMYAIAFLPGLLPIRFGLIYSEYYPG